MLNPKQHEIKKLRHLAIEQRAMAAEMGNEKQEEYWNKLLVDKDPEALFQTGVDLFMSGVTFGNPNDEDFDGFGSWTEDLGKEAPEDEVPHYAFDKYSLLGQFSLEYAMVGAAGKFVSRLVELERNCEEVLGSRYNSDDLNKCCLASVRLMDKMVEQLELPHHGCYLYEKLTGASWTQVAITEGMARGLLGEIRVDAKEYDNKMFDLIRMDNRGRYLYVYKHDFEWLLVTAMPK